MFLSSRHELYVLLGTFIGGMTVGLVFDLFRIYRKNFKIASSLVWLQDILMWGAFLAVVYATVFITNDAQLRWYEFAGIILGVIVYMLTVSSLVIKVSTALISFFKKVFYWFFKIIFAPFVWLFKIIVPPMKSAAKWLKIKNKRFSKRKKFNFLRFYRLFKKI